MYFVLVLSHDPQKHLLKERPHISRCLLKLHSFAARHQNENGVFHNNSDMMQC